MKKRLSIKKEKENDFICKHNTELMMDLLSGKISDRNRGILASQLDNCVQCRNKLNELSRNLSEPVNARKSTETFYDSLGDDFHGSTDNQFKNRQSPSFEQLNELELGNILIIAEDAEFDMKNLNKIFLHNSLRLQTFNSDASTNSNKAFFDEVIENHKEFESVFIYVWTSDYLDFVKSLLNYGKYILLGLPEKMSWNIEKELIELCGCDSCGRLAFFNKTRLSEKALELNRILKKAELGSVSHAIISGWKWQTVHSPFKSADSKFQGPLSEQIWELFSILDLTQWFFGPPDSVIAKYFKPLLEHGAFNISMIFSYNNGLSLVFSTGIDHKDSCGMKIHAENAILTLDKNGLTIDKYAHDLHGLYNESFGKWEWNGNKNKEKLSNNEKILRNFALGVRKKCDFICSSKSLCETFKLMNCIFESLKNNGRSVNP